MMERPGVPVVTSQPATSDVAAVRQNSHPVTAPSVLSESVFFHQEQVLFVESPAVDVPPSPESSPNFLQQEAILTAEPTAAETVLASPVAVSRKKILASFRYRLVCIGYSFLAGGHGSGSGRRAGVRGAGAAVGSHVFH